MWPGAARGAHRLGSPRWAGPCCPPWLARCPPRPGSRPPSLFLKCALFRYLRLTVLPENVTPVFSVLSNLGSERAAPQGLRVLPASHRFVARPSCRVAGHASVVSSVTRLLLIRGALGLVYSAARPFLDVKSSLVALAVIVDISCWL